MNDNKQEICYDIYDVMLAKDHGEMMYDIGSEYNLYGDDARLLIQEFCEYYLSGYYFVRKE